MVISILIVKNQISIIGMASYRFTVVGAVMYSEAKNKIQMKLVCYHQASTFNHPFTWHRGHYDFDTMVQPLAKLMPIICLHNFYYLEAKR